MLWATLWQFLRNQFKRLISVNLIPFNYPAHHAFALFNELRKGETIEPLSSWRRWRTYCLLIAWWIHPIITTKYSQKGHLILHSHTCTYNILQKVPWTHKAFLSWMCGVCVGWEHRKILSSYYIFAHTDCRPCCISCGHFLFPYLWV